MNVENTRRREISLQFIRRQVDCVEEALEMMNNRSIIIDNMVTHRFPFSRTKVVSFDPSRLQDGAMKAMIDLILDLEIKDIIPLYIKPMKKEIVLFLTSFFRMPFQHGQNVGSSPEYIKAITSQWKGERFADGRPKVSDVMLERLKNIPIEAAWAVLRNKGYLNQFEGDWTIIYPEKPMTGRSVTAQYMPLRPDLKNG